MCGEGRGWHRAHHHLQGFVAIKFQWVRPVPVSPTLLNKSIQPGGGISMHTARRIAKAAFAQTSVKVTNHSSSPVAILDMESGPQGLAPKGAPLWSAFTQTLRPALMKSVSTKRCSASPQI
mmetsp:Transcript_97833/g.168671  ORF Transcript_97833/g.168671 Transcript_97833/m.168671 type:complete len:121 (-) Transcript_97833:179-541(-)